jgi:hypothetical protein
MNPKRTTTRVHSVIFFNIQIDFEQICSSSVNKQEVNKQEETSHDVTVRDGGKHTLLRYVILNFIKN